MKIDELWEDTPIEEGRYLWRLGPKSDLYQMCYVVKDFTGNLVSHSTSAQHWPSSNTGEKHYRVSHDSVFCSETDGQWLFITPRSDFL